MGFRIPRKSSDEVRSAGKYHYICTYRAAAAPCSYIHTDVVSATTAVQRSRIYYVFLFFYEIPSTLNYCESHFIKLKADSVGNYLLQIKSKLRNAGGDK